MPGHLLRILAHNSIYHDVYIPFSSLRDVIGTLDSSLYIDTLFVCIEPREFYATHNRIEDHNGYDCRPQY